jgi:DnaK suppressor protein
MYSVDTFAQWDVFVMFSIEIKERCDVEENMFEGFKTLLLDQKRQLIQQANETVARESNGVQGQLADYADIATLESDRTFHLRLRDRERKLVQKIDQALERIEDGTFGLCERCGEDIGTERLKARPVTTFCINCKTRLEEEEVE